MARDPEPGCVCRGDRIDIEVLRNVSERRLRAGFDQVEGGIVRRRGLGHREAGERRPRAPASLLDPGRIAAERLGARGLASLGVAAAGLLDCGSQCGQTGQ
jgi:hypothetical protein